MKILLINNNPVVSRLTALSARKEDIEIDEIQEVTELNSDTYDIVFVDADSWSKDVRDVISENIKVEKSVLFYSDGDKEEKASFDLSILKPFLPSEVSAVIRSLEEERASSRVVSEENHFNILEDTKESTREELFTLDGMDELKEDKIKVLNNENKKFDFDEKLEESFPLKINTLDDDLFEDKSKESGLLGSNDILEKPEIKNELFDLNFNTGVASLEDDLFSSDKKEDILDIKELELDDKGIEPIGQIKEETFSALEGSVLKLDEVKQKTQVLDESEIEKIKGILTEDTSDDMTLEDLMPPVIPSMIFKKEEEKKEELSVATVPSLDSSVLAQTLSAMPIQQLRELLAGATVNIKIKFPKEK